jgi:Ca-activated chloride channel family protein
MMSEFFLQFHFLRPWFLLTLIPTAGLFIWNRQVKRKSNQFSVHFAAHLLPYLLVGDIHKNFIKPEPVLLTLWLLTIFSLAGPSWQREPSPFVEDQAALVLVLKVTPTMMASDIPPSRLIRSWQKISDLLALRQGAKTALVAYAGSAHRVMPLTKDSNVIVSFARELSPEVMPKDGDNPVAALTLASTILTDAETSGAILLIADGMPVEMETELQKFIEKNQYPVQVLVMAAPPGASQEPGAVEAPPLNRNEMRRLTKALAAEEVEVTANTRDVEAIHANIKQSYQKRLMKEGERWRDGGYYFIPFIVFLALFWARRGWRVSWEGGR